MEALCVVSFFGAWKLIASSWIRSRMMKQFEYFGTVSTINIYPVKACRATKVDSASCSPQGLQVDGITDRNIMIVEIVNGIGHCRLMKHFPKLTLVQIDIREDTITLNAPDMKPLTLQHHPDSNGRKLVCDIDKMKVTALDYGDEAARWFSAYLHGAPNVRLVCNIDSNKRRTKDIDREGNSNVLESDTVTFSCVSSYLITNERTLEELNKLLTEPVKMDNFRSNIVIDGKNPYEEDKWRQIIIGEKATFRCQESCARCMITTINTETAQRNKQNEPLRTLKSYKKKTNGPATTFGVYAAIDHLGSISVGDSVYVLK